MDQDVRRLPVSAVIATADRPAVLRATMASVLLQSSLPSEFIIVDASVTFETAQLCDELNRNGLPVRYEKAEEKGAGAQRNQGVVTCRHPYVLFMDDDILLESRCIEILFNSISTKDDVGGVNAMITNQRYTPPGAVSRIMYRLMSGKKMDSYAGQCIGPAWNLLPEDRESLPDLVPVAWLNTTCTMYRREALPQPPFHRHFQGYSYMEDVALSLIVARTWKLLNARKARIFHDSQPGKHKSDAAALAEMELTNRLFIMEKILSRTSFPDYLRFYFFQLYQVLTSIFNQSSRKNFIPMIKGKVRAIKNRQWMY
jgi:glycosyltransferase involved in cell wall biosynthesis